MKPNPVFLILVGVTSIILACSAALPVIILQNSKAVAVNADQPEKNSDKTLSPYFFVKNGDESLDQLPLKSTSAQVNIAGVIADVTVMQVYENKGKKPIEAVYVFPASTRAAVYGLKMTIGERTLIAKIAEKEKARADYEAAKKSGRTASLLEQERPNVFQMNVANIMPGDKVVVELKYTENCIPEEGIYRFVYPTVVGPRYSNRSENEVPASEKWVSNPYTHEGEKPFSTFDIRCKIDAGLPIKDVQCTSHRTNVQYENLMEASVNLDPGEKEGGNRDFILEYRLTGNAVQSGILLYKGETENFFMAMIQPPQRFRQSEVLPREFIFIMDVSGSMSGYPLNISKKLMHDLIQSLRPTDKFNVLLFAGGNSLFSEQSVPATPLFLEQALTFIDREQGGGGTELLPALKRAMALKTSDGYARSFMIATDGYVDIEKEAFSLIRHNLNKANFFAFGIGTSVNRYLIEGIANAGSGHPFIVTEESKAGVEAAKLRTYIESPLLSHVKIRFNGFDAYDVNPLSIPDVLSDRPVLIYGKYRGEPAGSIEISGVNAMGAYSEQLNVNMNHPKATNNALQYLWARQLIRDLDDMGESDSDTKKQVTELGLKYNLLTQYTSFIAIDSEVRNQQGNSTTVIQPLPLPEGVSNQAVGASYAAGSANIISGIAVEKTLEMEEIAAESKDQAADTDELNVVFSVVEEMPTFPGGETAMKSFLEKNLLYPENAKLSCIQGTVYISFKVSAEGNVYDIIVLRGIGGGCDEEAVRVVSLMPPWNPGKMNAKNVVVSMTIPVSFKLSSKK